MIDIKVLSIEETGVENFFVPFNDDKNFKKAVKELWEKGISLPGWCFVLEKNGEIIGRSGFFASSESKRKVKMFGLVLPVGEQKESGIFLKKVFGFLKRTGVEEVEYQVHLGVEEITGGLKKILEDLGMEKKQTKKSFLLETHNYHLGKENRLEFKNLVQVGSQFFKRAILEVTRGTLDREDRENMRIVGEEKAAEQFFSTLSSIDAGYENWFLGFFEDDFLGLVIPQKIGKNLGAINYIGVIPRYRGLGFSKDLLDQGIRNLKKRGVKKIIADIDEKNFPLEKVLNLAGFKEKEKIINFYFLL